MAFPTINMPTFPANAIGGSAAPVGGLCATGDGGYIIIGGSSVSNAQLIDVERWRIVTGYGESPLAKGGMMGATSSRRTGYSHVWEADILLDLRIEPFVVLGEQLEVELLFRVGTPIIDEIPGTLRIDPRYYWLARAHIDSASPAVAVKKLVRQRINGVANCHLFLLPDDGNPNDRHSRAGAYKQWLGTNEVR
jgi:hypothetical protein